MTYEAFRQYGGPTFYEAVHIPWEGDILTSGLIFCFAILALSFYIILPGLVGKEKTFTFLRITLSMFIGAVILVTNFAMTWDTAETKTVTKYKAGLGQNVNVTVGVHIGFRGINITLKGEKDQIKGETINYNENFNWEGGQGRLGFGPFAGQFNKQFRAAQIRGVPLPILAVAEYFTLDGEGIRWGRFYRQAGWYAHIVLWMAFPLWILSNILFFVLLRYGAYCLALTGLSMIASNIIWATMRNPTDLKIHFSAHDTLNFSYGAAFWICLVTGILCVVFGITVFLLDKLLPTQTATFFGVDVLQDSEIILFEEEEESVISSMSREVNIDFIDSSSASVVQAGDSEDDDYSDGAYLTPPQPVPKISPVPDAARPFVIRTQTHRKSFRSSEHRLTKKLQRPRRKEPPRRSPQGEEDTDGDYVNVSERRTEPSWTVPQITFGERQNTETLSEMEATASVRMTGFQSN